MPPELLEAAVWPSTLEGSMSVSARPSEVEWTKSSFCAIYSPVVWGVSPVGATLLSVAPCTLRVCRSLWWSTERSKSMWLGVGPK